MKLVAICTAKGLLIYSINENRDVELHSKHFIGFSVNIFYLDPFDKRWWVGISHKHWGQKLHYSDNEGCNWQESKMPSLEGEHLPNGRPAKLNQIWSMESGGQKGAIWLGTDPGALFKSEDNGKSWSLNRAIWEHPSRKEEGLWFGAGSNFPFLHTIIVNPSNSDHLYIGVSSAGVFESLDCGETWNPKNNGLVATYLPNPNTEIGYDPHRILMNQNEPDILWQQNHCGVFVTKNGGKDWIDVSVHDKQPYYGFTILTDDNYPERAWVIPVESDNKRVAPDLRLQVYYTDNFGESWVSRSKGLPQHDVFDIVLRQAADSCDNFIVFGTTNGNVYLSDQNKEEWKSIANHLTKVNFVKVI